MGKSPGRWIKTVLFGKKSSKSHNTKGRERILTEKPVTPWASEDDAIPSLVISHPIPVATIGSVRHLELENQDPLYLPRSRTASLPGNEEENFQQSIELSDDERRRQEEAATLAQAAFRGYSARRAFQALKGIIRLQALIRGHLVRRQAVATLCCILGVVKMQALARGVKVRTSDIGLEVQRRWGMVKPLEDQLGDSNGANISILRASLSANAFVRKLVASSLAVMPLHLYYDHMEPNSVTNWLERWSASCFWKPIPQPKKIRFPTSRRKKGNNVHMLEAETGRPKQSVRRVTAANIDNNSVQATAEDEKPKRNLREVLSHLVDTPQENPQSEIEKVKRNLRKVQNPVMEMSLQSEVGIEKLKLNLEKEVSGASADDHPVHGMNSSEEKMKKETKLTAPGLPDAINEAATLTLSKSLETEMTSEPPVMHEASEIHGDQAVIELEVENGSNSENTPTSGELSHKEEATSNQNHKANRKSSNVVKQERAENGLQKSSPALPSYMAATESAKSKLRAQGSPRLNQDEAEKNNITRRHSLPSSANIKVSSQSPRTRTVQSGGKAGNKIDKSMISSRGGNAKAAQVGWRR